MSKYKNVAVEEELHTKLKTQASQDKKSIKDFVSEAIEKELEVKKNG